MIRLSRPALGLTAAFFLALMPVAQAQSASACGLSQAAFCDTFDAPQVNGGRGGDLAPVWGVSRASQDDNPSQGVLNQWGTANESICGAGTPIGPPRDVRICNGQLVDVLNDNGAVAVLAMYPRQPFDIAGRTGTVTFDVNNDTQGGHGAWPVFVYTDQPVPAPHTTMPGVQDAARNAMGVSIATPNCGGNDTMTGVDKIWIDQNYVESAVNYTTTGCVKKSTTPSQLNRFQFRLSQSHIEVWGSDAGSTTLRQLVTADVQLPLTRGLVWAEDAHYAGDKFGSQGTHAFTWDNFGFDGPVLPRDLGFSVPDATHTGTSGGNLGYSLPLTTQILNVSSIDKAGAALLEFTFTPRGDTSITYALNGHAAHTQSHPFTMWGVSETLAVPVPLSELQPGTNTVALSVTGSLGGVSISNIDLILVGAGGTPDGLPTAVPTSTSSPTATTVPSNTATPTVVPSSTPVPTTQPTASPSPTTTVGIGPMTCALNIDANGNVTGSCVRN